MIVNLPNRLLIYLFIFISLFICSLIPSFYTLPQASEQLHQSAELLASFLALIVGTLALLRYNCKADYRFLILGVGFISTAVLDGIHSLTIITELSHYITNQNEDKASWSWVPARLVLAITFLLTYISWRYSYNNYSRRLPSKTSAYFIGIMLVITFTVITLFIELPNNQQSQGLITRAADWLTALLFLLSLAGYLIKGVWRTDNFEHLIIISLILNLMAQIFFMGQSNLHFDSYAQVAHFLKISSYLLVLIGLLIKIQSSLKQLERVIHFDKLTQLPNHVLFADRFNQAVAHSHRNELLLGICFIDLDNFKPINDKYGHQMGDYLLCQVADRIRTQIREEDTLSRRGGDEFALLLGDIKSIQHSQQMLERIHLALTYPFRLNGDEVTITASSGLSLYPNDNSDLDTLCKHANHALYQAKQAGKNRFRTYINDEYDFTNQHIHLNDVRHALVVDQLTLFYQPKVEIKTGKIIGFEALIRWLHPEKGLLSPAHFLPLIETTDVEIQVGRWVIEQALEQLEQWQEQDLYCQVSVNISSYHIQSEGFLTHLEGALSRHPSVNASALQLEILESSILSDITTINSILKSCRNNLGVHIALDDFGTGYSSLTHLRNLPVDTVKIDQTFVHAILDNPSDYSIINGMISLTHAFNQTVIAEGVERTEEGLLLLYMGCELAQGYGISRPMPATEIINWINSYQPNQTWINCKSEALSLQKKKIEIFKLMLSRWLERFENALLSEDNNLENWPILNEDKCHMGCWLNRQRALDNFSPEMLQRLQHAHNEMHEIAQDLAIKHQSGHFELAREGLNEFQKSVSKIRLVIDQDNK